MTNRRLYRSPEETARHRQMKQLCLEYFTQYEKLMKHPSKTYATRARKACIRLKKVIHARGIELLELYAPSLNTDRDPIYPIKHWKKTLDKREKEQWLKNQEEEHQDPRDHQDEEHQCPKERVEEESNAS